MQIKKNRKHSEITKHLGPDTKIYQHDPTEKQTFALVTGPNCALVVAWEQDHTEYGFWRIKLVGTKRNGIVTKEFAPGAPHAAFYGSMSVIGVGQTELYASFGYEDDDIKDEDGNIVNKVKELRLYPVREE